MLKEYTVVRLKRSVADVPVTPGTKGAVAMVHLSDPPAYEVEFFDSDGSTVGVYTMKDADLEEITS